MSKIKNDDTQPSRPVNETVNKRRINRDIFILGWIGVLTVLLFYPLVNSSNPSALIATATPMPTPIPPRVIIEHIQPMGQLVTVSVEVAEADIHVGVRDGLCSHGADYVAQGAIEAGVDFDAIEEDSIIYDPASQSYTLRLPAAHITSCRIEYIRQYANSFSLCNPDWDRARIFARHQAMSDFVDEVLENGILKQAENQSTLHLGSFVSSLTGKLTHIEYEKASAKAKLPSSCELYIPRGWQYSRSKKAWVKTD